MSRRNEKGQFAAPPSKRSLILSWGAGLVSLVLLIDTANMVRNTFAAFRSCASNNDGLTVHACGKQALDPGDLVVIGLFILAACLSLTIFTHAWRLTRRTMP